MDNLVSYIYYVHKMGILFTVSLLILIIYLILLYNLHIMLYECYSRFDFDFICFGFIICYNWLSDTNGNDNLLLCVITYLLFVLFFILVILFSFFINN